MKEIILRANSRMAIVNGLVTVLLTVAIVLLAYRSSLLAIRATLVVLAGYVFFFGLWTATRPRLAYCDGYLVVYLHPIKSIKLPVDIVEVFFMGQGPISGASPKNDDPTAVKAANVVIRLAEAATDWHERDVGPMYGVWKEGYITVRGMWCERLNADVIQRMNHRLVAIKRSRRGKKAHS